MELSVREGRISAFKSPSKSRKTLWGWVGGAGGIRPSQLSALHGVQDALGLGVYACNPSLGWWKQADQKIKSFLAT